MTLVLSSVVYVSIAVRAFVITLNEMKQYSNHSMKFDLYMYIYIFPHLQGVSVPGPLVAPVV